MIIDKKEFTIKYQNRERWKKRAKWYPSWIHVHSTLWSKNKRKRTCNRDW